MPSNPLFHPVEEAVRTANLRDQIQIALAIADSNLLKSLLLNCIPAVADGQQHTRSMTAQVGVPIGNQQTADGIVHFEVVQCILSDSARPVEQTAPGGWTRESRELANLTQHESEMQTLKQNLALAPAVSLLAESGFSPKQIEEILRLPYDAWHKSWWHAIDANGNFTVPFLRHIRTLRYPDGTLTIQYKDFFEQDSPRCFTSLPQKVLVMIKPDTQGFSETLRQINQQREALGIAQAILICSTISDLEAQGFINQGISIYPAIELVLPTQSNCIHCGRKECAMNGTQDSPVALCYGFLPESEFV